MTPDPDSGQAKESWDLLCSAWAQLVPQTADERFQSDALHAVRRQLWRIPYRADLVEMDQVRYSNVVYKITGIQELGRKDLLELTTEVFM